jgi:hypothetical protein
MPLSQREIKAIAKAKEQQQQQPLYRSLHLVGDDPIKSTIEDALQELLPPDSFKNAVQMAKEEQEAA